MKGELSSACGIGALLCALLVGCGNPTGDMKEVVVWPGMDVTKFNRLNADSASQLKSTDTDWIGINSPVTLVFRHGPETLRISGTRLGGGMQIMSSNLTPSLAYDGPARVQMIAFNIGGGMENISKQMALLVDRCDRLARFAGLIPKPIPDAETLSKRLRGAKGAYVEVCGGEGSTLTFQVTARHYDSDWRYGSDYSRAYLDGSLGVPSRITVH